MATFQVKQALSSVDSHVPSLTGFTETPKRSFDTPSSQRRALSSLVAVLIHSSGMHQSCSSQWGLGTCKNHVSSPCSAHKLPLEISFLFFLVFPPVLTWVIVQWPLFSACMSTALTQPPTHAPREPWNPPLAAAGRSRRSKSFYTLSWHWLSRHLAAQSTQVPTVFAHISPLQSQRHPNSLVLHATEQRHHYMCWPELLLALSLKQQHVAPAQRPKAKIIQTSPKAWACPLSGPGCPQVVGAPRPWWI